MDRGVLRSAITLEERRLGCAAFRAFLVAHPDERLRPRDLRGAVESCAYLEAELHAEPCLVFLADYFGVQAPWPAAGVQVTVFTRFDSDDRPPLTLRLLRGLGSAGESAPLEMHLYNSSGRGEWGFHYDPMRPAPERTSQAAGGSASSSQGRHGTFLKRHRGR